MWFKCQKSIEILVIKSETSRRENQYKWSETGRKKYGRRLKDRLLDRQSLPLTSLDKSSEILA
jgi:hypothetical protein